MQIEKQTFTVQPFYIAKYPITYQQFQVFVDAEDGFKNHRWWKDLSVDKEDKSKPGEQNFKFYNHPRQTVSWHDSIAFCRWLNARLGWAELPSNLTVKALENFRGVRLPAEWEWQWAATGGSPDQKYPWGMEWDGNKTNTAESGLSRTTAVGLYPANSARCGALDMSGNVLEWCLNEYSNLRNIGLDGTENRVLRGGSWFDDQVDARGSSRIYSLPYERLNSLGFRVVVRSPSL